MVPFSLFCCISYSAVQNGVIDWLLRHEGQVSARKISCNRQPFELLNSYSTRACWISNVIIQQIVTMPIYGKEALNICHPYMTDILRYT